MFRAFVVRTVVEKNYPILRSVSATLTRNPLYILSQDLDVLAQGPKLDSMARSEFKIVISKMNFEETVCELGTSIFLRAFFAAVIQANWTPGENKVMGLQQQK
ncbi:hypothetical protein E4U31_005034 [Claviceps sp. LM219 group G6]|nr:hypothetical protein E4U31_005034 [Claviceps sp. LM219 group G6]